MAGGRREEERKRGKEKERTFRSYIVSMIFRNMTNRYKNYKSLKLLFFSKLCI